jgi:hypothetical protein
MNKMMSFAAMVAVAGSFGVASADISRAVHGPIIAPFDAVVDVQFVSRSAGWVGELSFIGNGVTPNSPMALLRNDAARGDKVDAMFSVSAGQGALFQYEIVRGTKNVFRQDDEAGTLQFKHAWISENTARLYVEDIKLPGGDADYNDAVFDVVFAPAVVPTPGSLALLGLGGVAAFRRRR